MSVVTLVPCHLSSTFDQIQDPKQPDELDPPMRSSHMEGRNTTGTGGDLQSDGFYPRLRGSHLLTNRLSVTSWQSLASSWHTNMACSKEAAVA